MAGEILLFRDAVELLPKLGPLADEVYLAAERLVQEARLLQRVPLENLPDIENSMAPKAFKVLSEDGRSPWAPSVRWSLPKQQADGSWLPGAWKQARSNVPIPLMRHDGIPKLAGLYVTDSPIEWRDMAERAVTVDQRFGFKSERIPLDLHQLTSGWVKVPRTKVFEVEIGDAASRELWMNKPSDDFAAQRIRLLRPLQAVDLKPLLQSTKVSAARFMPSAQNGAAFVVEQIGGPSSVKTLQPFVVEEIGGPSPVKTLQPLFSRMRA